MARWSSDVVLRYVAEALLQGMSDAYRRGLSTAVGETAEEVLRQLEVVKSEALQDKRLIHYLQHEVATLNDIEDVKVKDFGYIVNTEWCAGQLCGQGMLFRSVGGLFVAGPSGLVSTRSRLCRRWVL